MGEMSSYEWGYNVCGDNAIEAMMMMSDGLNYLVASPNKGGQGLWLHVLLIDLEFRSDQGGGP